MILAWQHVNETLKENSSIVAVVFHSSKLQNISKVFFEIALTHRQCCLVCVGVSVPHGKMAHHNRLITVFSQGSGVTKTDLGMASACILPIGRNGKVTCHVTVFE